MSDIAPPTGWSVVDGKLHREFEFKDFPAESGGSGETLAE